MLYLIYTLNSTCVSLGSRYMSWAPLLVLFLTMACQMTKLKQLSEESDVLIQGRTIYGSEEGSASQAVSGTLLPRGFG